MVYIHVVIKRESNTNFAQTWYVWSPGQSN